MTADFYKRLRDYYQDVAEGLRADASRARILPNGSDRGSIRESAYAQFLKRHIPSMCNIDYGGFVFADDGEESKQIDIIITSDTCHRFSLPDGGLQKSFAHIEGTLGVVSVKSTLNRDELEDALKGIASIPSTGDISRRAAPGLPITQAAYNDWPYKIIYASNGISGDTLLGHLNDFYSKNPQIPIHRRPDVVHVLGQYALVRTKEHMNLQAVGGTSVRPPPGVFHINDSSADLQAIMWVLFEMQHRATLAGHILYSYGTLLNSVMNTTLES